jgi:hypothetical protein
MKLAASVRCRHCGRQVASPDDPEFYALHFTVVDRHADQWSCGACLTRQEKRDIVLQLASTPPDEGELAEVTPQDIAKAVWEAGLVPEEELLLHQFVNISWRALDIAVHRVAN